MQRSYYVVTPDICTLGKIIGGGFPLAALGASRDLMAHFDKQVVGQDKWLMQLGTLSGNPVASVAGLKTMEILRRPGQYEKLRRIGQTLMNLHIQVFEAMGVSYRLSGDPTLFDVYFTDSPCTDYRSAKHQEPQMATLWNKVLRQEGILKSPSKLYPSLTLRANDLEETKAAMEKAAKALRDGFKK